MENQLSNQTKAAINSQILTLKQQHHKKKLSEDGDQSSEDDIYDDEATTNGILQRVAAQNINKHPYDCIGIIVAQDQDEKKTVVCCGTGFLISSNFIMSAAHVVFDKKSKKIRKNLKFYIDFQKVLKNPVQISNVRLPTQYSQIDFQKVLKNPVQISNVRLPTQYSQIAKANRGNIIYDYALCMLKQEVIRNQYIQLTLNFSNLFQNIMIAGYPGLSKYKNQYEAQMKFSVGLQEGKSIIKIKNNKIIHSLSTQSGHSGSPVLIQQHYAVGIHKAGIRKNETQDAYANGAILLCKDMVNNLQKWSAEMDYQKRYRSHILDYQYIKHRKILKSIQFKDMIPIYDLNYKDFTQEFPLCCIGRIRVEKEKEMMGPVRCNGILISENLVLTVISGIVKCFRYTGLQNLKITFQIKIKDSFIKHEVQSYIINKKFLDLTGIKQTEKYLQNIKYDYCLLRLKNTIIYPRYMPLLVNYNNKSNTTSFYGFKLQENSGQFQKCMRGRKSANAINQISIEQKFFFHQFQTGNGLAGSPLIFQDYLIAYHNGVYQYGFNKKIVKIGRLITVDLIQQLLEWNIQLKGQNFKVFYWTNSGKIVQISDIKHIKQLQLKK